MFLMDIKSLGPTIKLIFSPKLMFLLVLYLTYVMGIIWIANKIGIWEQKLLKDTVIITFGIGLPLLIESINNSDGLHIIRNAARKIFGISIFISLYLALSPFSIPGELAIQILIIITSLCLVVSTQSEQKKIGVERFLKSTLSTIGIGMLLFTAVEIRNTWHTIDFADWSHSFAMTIWLPILIVPFAFILSFYAATEIALTLTRTPENSSWKRRIILFGIFWGLRGSIKNATSFSFEWREKASKANDLKSINRVMEDFRKSISK